MLLGRCIHREIDVITPGGKRNKRIERDKKQQQQAKRIVQFSLNHNYIISHYIVAPTHSAHTQIHKTR